MFIGFNAKYLLFLSAYNKTNFFSIDFRGILKY